MNSDCYACGKSALLAVLPLYHFQELGPGIYTCTQCHKLTCRECLGCCWNSTNVYCLKCSAPMTKKLDLIKEVAKKNSSENLVSDVMSLSSVEYEEKLKARENLIKEYDEKNKTYQCFTLDQCILEIVRCFPKGISIPELMSLLENTLLIKTKGEATWSNNKEVFWSGLTVEFYEKIQELLKNDSIEGKESTPIVYLMDGYLSPPLMKGEKWCPLVFVIGSKAPPALVEQKERPFFYLKLSRRT